MKVLSLLVLVAFAAVGAQSTTTDKATTAPPSTTGQATTTTRAAPRRERPAVSTRFGDLILTSPRDIIFRRNGGADVAFDVYVDRLDAVEESATTLATSIMEAKQEATAAVENLSTAVRQQFDAAAAADETARESLSAAISTTMEENAFDDAEARATLSTDISHAMAGQDEALRMDVSSLSSALGSALTTAADNALGDAKDYTDGQLDNAVATLTAQTDGVDEKLDNAVTTLTASIEAAAGVADEALEKINAFKNPAVIKSCLDVARAGFDESKFYLIYPDGETPLKVFCDLELNYEAKINSGRNLARGRPATQTTTTNGAPASRAVDGGRSGIFNDNSCTHTGTHSIKHLTVDLGAVYEIDMFRLFGRTDCCQSRMNGMELYVSVDNVGEPWTWPRCLPGTFSAPNPGQEYRCSDNVFGRFVSVVVKQGGEPVSICELEVFGSPTAGPENDFFLPQPFDFAGWTLLASAPSEVHNLQKNLASLYNKQPPSYILSGALGYFLTKDLKAFFTELYVENSRGDYAIYKLADLEGSIVLGGANRIVAAEDKRKGIIFGNNYPVSSHYQVGAVCASATSCPSPGVSESYSYGVLIMFDWNIGSDDASTLINTAHFGGNANIESRWASRGVRLLAR